MFILEDKRTSFYVPNIFKIVSVGYKTNTCMHMFQQHLYISRLNRVNLCVRSLSLSWLPLPVSSSSVQTCVLSGCKQLEKCKDSVNISDRVPHN